MRNIFTAFSRERILRIGIFGGILIFLTRTSLFISQSESVEGKVFLILKGSSWNKRDLVGIKDFELPDQSVMSRLLKKVGGVAGDRVWIKGGKIFINDECIGPLFKETSLGKSLNHINPPGVIPLLIPLVNPLIIPVGNIRDNACRRRTPFGRTPFGGAPAEVTPVGANSISDIMTKTTSNAKNILNIPKWQKSSFSRFIIPENCIFLAGTHPRSFDSRYKEFGLLCDYSKVLGKAIRII